MRLFAKVAIIVDSHVEKGCDDSETTLSLSQPYRGQCLALFSLKALALSGAGYGSGSTPCILPPRLFSYERASSSPLAFQRRFEDGVDS